MAWYHNFINNAPDELNGFIATIIIPGPPFADFLHGNQYCGIVWWFTGRQEAFDKLIKPAMDLAPVFAHAGEMPYPSIQTLFDGLMTPDLQWYWRADFFNELGLQVRAQHLKFGSSIPTPLSQMHLYPISGAASRVGAEYTPWAYRDAKYAGVIVGVSPKPKDADKITKWCKDY